jgi:RIO kinase 1
MEVRLKRITEDDAVATEHFGRHNDRRKPRRKTKREEFYVTDDVATSSADKFTDPELQRLYEARKISDLISELKSGKEATVYLVEGPAGLMAAKIYADLEVRSFKNDSTYRDGRFIADVRTARAVRSRSRYGLSAQQHMWVLHEYQQLWQLHDAGLPVPKPMIGPEASELGASGRVVLMELIGDRNAPAPRLADIRLEAEAAHSAFEQSVSITERLYAMGKIHGDMSTYNLLWWQGRVVCIDLPQMIDASGHPRAQELLERDVMSLCKSFRKVGMQADPGQVLRRVRAAGTAGVRPSP